MTNDERMTKLEVPTLRRKRRKEIPSSVTEWHNANELARVILDCGGKRSATPLSDRQKSDFPQCFRGCRRSPKASIGSL